MCMIIDANVFPCVFSPNNAKHSKFKPVLEWLIFGKAKMILGGKLFREEILQKQKSFTPLLLELNKLNKIHMLDNDLIDNKEQEIKSKENDPDFDDPHIIALAIESRCKLICSDDARSFKFIHKIKTYDNNSIEPSIYTTISHAPHTELLCDSNICSNGIHTVLDKTVATKIFNIIEGISN